MSLNRYIYARDNPMKYTDPNGHVFIDEDGYLYIASGTALRAAGVIPPVTTTTAMSTTTTDTDPSGTTTPTVGQPTTTTYQPRTSTYSPPTVGQVGAVAVVGLAVVSTALVYTISIPLSLPSGGGVFLLDAGATMGTENALKYTSENWNNPNLNFGSTAWACARGFFGYETLRPGEAPDVPE